MNIGVLRHFVADTQAGTHSEKMTLPWAPIVEEFSPSEVVAAIRAARADTIRYPEFVKRSVEAGAIGYWRSLPARGLSTSAAKPNFTSRSLPAPNVITWRNFMAVG